MFKKILCSIMAIVMVSCFSVSAFAATDNPSLSTDVNSQDVGQVEEILASGAIEFKDINSVDKQEVTRLDENGDEYTVGIERVSTTKSVGGRQLSRHISIPVRHRFSVFGVIKMRKYNIIRYLRPLLIICLLGFCAWPFNCRKRAFVL